MTFSIFKVGPGKVDVAVYSTMGEEIYNEQLTLSGNRNVRRKAGSCVHSQSGRLPSIAVNFGDAYEGKRSSQ